MKRVDILLPVYNGLDYVRSCVESVLKQTDESLYNLRILDDCSDEKTRDYLDIVASENPHVSVTHRAENVGFVQNCNLGLRECNLEWVLLLNSDVLVTPNWLEGLLTCGDSDSAIASVNPLTNKASQIDVPMFPGCSYLEVNQYFSGLSRPETGFPDIVTGVGFCMLLRRCVIEAMGFFDEVYGRGYCEESDLCMRLTTSGYRTVVAPTVYVYHKGGGTFTDKGERYRINRKVFDERWKKEYSRQFSEFLKENPIQRYRDLMSSRKRWDPLLGTRFAFRNIRGQFRAGNYKNTLKAAIRGTFDAVTCTVPVVNDRDLLPFKDQERLSVTYILHNLTVAGGVLSVIQLVNQLIQQGVDARVVALREYPEIYDWQLLVRPVIYASPRDLINNLPKTDIAVATHWTTAPWVDALKKKGRTKAVYYFLQDYEPWFFSESEAEKRQTVSDTFSLIGDKVVKSDWLRGMLEADGFNCEKIRLGMNLDIFYPRRVKRETGVIRVLAMARPRTPRRGFDDLVSALTEVLEKTNRNIEIVFFGEEVLPDIGAFEYKNMGVITNQGLLAELYSSCDIFIDSSTFQGFGRTALEAMACGVACVVTNVGGVNEYAEDDVNCLAVDPGRPDLIAGKVLRLIEDDDLRTRLSERGVLTASNFCHRREGRETLDYLISLKD